MLRKIFSDYRTWTAALLLVIAAIAFLKLNFPSGGSNETGSLLAPNVSSSTASPVEIRIPSIGVDAQIIPVGKTKSGAMDAPANAVQTGWYALGAWPGQPGNAVIDGHLD